MTKGARAGRKAAKTGTNPTDAIDVIETAIEATTETAATIAPGRGTAADHHEIAHDRQMPETITATIGDNDLVIGMVHGGMTTEIAGTDGGTTPIVGIAEVSAMLYKRI